MGYCEDRTSNCNCDGSYARRRDEGKIIDKSKLPILGTHTPTPRGAGYIRIGILKCANKPFG